MISTWDVFKKSDKTGTDASKNFIKHCTKQEELHLEDAMARTEGMAAAAVITPAKEVANKTNTSQMDQWTEAPKVPKHLMMIVQQPNANALVQ